MAEILDTTKGVGNREFDMKFDAPNNLGHQTSLPGNAEFLLEPATIESDRANNRFSSCRVFLAHLASLKNSLSTRVEWNPWLNGHLGG